MGVQTAKLTSRQKALVANNVHLTYNANEDAQQAGGVALIKAAQRFSPRKGVKFATFARHLIRGSTIDELHPKRKYHAKGFSPQFFSLPVESNVNGERERRFLRRPDLTKAISVDPPACVDIALDVQDALSCLSLRDREIVYLKFAEEKTQKEIGDRFGLSESRISQIVSRLTPRIRDILEARGL